MLRLNDIVEEVLAYHPNADIDMIRRAYVFSAQAHQGQVRKSGEPYLAHPIAVSSLLADMRLDEHAICAGILHDTVEDTDTTVEQIADLFGQQVADIVDGVTKLNIPFNNQFEKQAENFRRMLVAMSKDIRVILVKLADRLHNMRTLEHMRPDKQERIAQETLDIYAPLANRLGIFWLKSALEDLCLRYLHPRDYAEIQRHLKATARDREEYMKEIGARLSGVMADEGLQCEVKGRIKHAFSIWRKLRAQNLDFEQIHDIMAFRVLVADVGECYRALGRVHQTWRPVPGRFKDMIATPKPNGYQSLHTTVIGPDVQRVEIQIRTSTMHEVAENGVAAHWAYKEGRPRNDGEDQFDWLRQLMVWQQELDDPTDFMSSVKVDLFSDEVFIFTPQGEVKQLKVGSTPIDFAYLIHSEVGNHCTGAKVNGRMVPLRYKLKSGDTVEILTAPDQSPKRDWMNHARTSKARNRIQAFLRAEDRRRIIETGREMLDKEAKRYGRSLQKLKKQGALDRALSSSRYSRADEFYAAIGLGRLRPVDALKKMVPEVVERGPQDKPSTPKLTQLFQGLAKKRKSHSGVVVAGIDDMLVRFARCCNPVPGDPIVGFVSTGRGITVHAITCDRTKHLAPERKVEVEWDDKVVEPREAQLRITSDDRAGMLMTMAAAISEYRVNISNANCHARKNGRAINYFTIEVTDTDQLRLVMRKLGELDGVFTVERLST